MSPLYIALMVSSFNSILVFLLYKRYKRNLNLKIGKNRKIKTTLVLGPGGHTREMVEIYNLLEHENHDFNFVHSSFDRRSPKMFTQKILKTLKYEYKDIDIHEIENKVKHLFYSLPFPSNRLFLYSFAITFFILNILKSLFLTFKIDSDLVITNGPGLSVPFCLAVKLLNVLLLRNTKIVYVESLARVRKLSLSGLLLCKIVDRSVVLWPNLASKHKNTTYLGTIQKLSL